MDREVIFGHTGCYTLAAFEIVNAAVVIEMGIGMKRAPHFGHSAWVTNYWLPFVGDFDIYRCLKRPREIRAEIAGDGEVVIPFAPSTCSASRSAVKVTPGRIANMIERVIQERGWGLFGSSYENVRSKISILKRAVKGTLTDKDRKSSFYAEVVGKPLGPLKQMIWQSALTDTAAKVKANWRFPSMGAAAVKDSAAALDGLFEAYGKLQE